MGGWSRKTKCQPHKFQAPEGRPSIGPRKGNLSLVRSILSAVKSNEKNKKIKKAETRTHVKHSWVKRHSKRASPHTNVHRNRTKKTTFRFVNVVCFIPSPVELCAPFCRVPSADHSVSSVWSFPSLSEVSPPSFRAHFRSHNTSS